MIKCVIWHTRSADWRILAATLFDISNQSTWLARLLDFNTKKMMIFTFLLMLGNEGKIQLDFKCWRNNEVHFLCIIQTLYMTPIDLQSWCSSVEQFYMPFNNWTRFKNSNAKSIPTHNITFQSLFIFKMMLVISK